MRITQALPAALTFVPEFVLENSGGKRVVSMSEKKYLFFRRMWSLSQMLFGSFWHHVRLV